jgi:hypothetical protein
MAWSESGLYAGVLYKSLAAPTATSSPNWIINTNKLFLTNNSDTPDFTQVASSAIYASTNEVHDSSAWPAGGVAASALATGSTDIVLALNASGSKVLSWTAGNVSVASTTLASPGAYGGYFYAAALSPQYKIIGIYFGGTGYITTAGTFAITWSSGTIATITCAT